MSTTGLYNSESSKNQIINNDLPQAANAYFISMWRFHCSMDEILKQQLLIRGRAFATFSTIEKALAGCKKSYRRLGYHETICNSTQQRW